MTIYKNQSEFAQLIIFISLIILCLTILCLLLLPNKQQEPKPVLSLTFRALTKDELESNIRKLGCEKPITREEIGQILGDMNASKVNN